MQAGLNLYSIRNKIQTEKDFLETAIKLKEYGYSYLQFSGAVLSAEQIRNVVKESGLPVYLTHPPYSRIVDDLDNLMKEHELFGCRCIGLGAMPRESIIDVDKCRKAVAELENAAKIMNKNGFKFFYHHHNFEFYKLFGDKTIFDYMIENAPSINFTADTYWLQFGGVSVVDFLEKLKGRIACVHLKDYKQEINEEGAIMPTFAPIGDGVMDFNTIIKKMKYLGTEYYFVEQDNAALLSDTMEQVKRSIDYLKNI